jgi:CO dehydrogenase maturation factor
VKIAVVGKGGAGKSVLAGTMARIQARRGKRVLVLDSDLLPGLSFSIGSGPDPDIPPLVEAAYRPEGQRWRLREGFNVVSAVKRYSTEGPDGIRLLQIGKMPKEGIQPIQSATIAFFAVAQRLGPAKTFADWEIIGDVPAGPRQVAFNFAPYAERYLVVAQPGAQSAMTARRVARVVRMRGGADVLFVANRVKNKKDVRHVEKLLGEPVFAALPVDPDVAEAERLGVAPIDHAPDSASVAAIGELVDRLEHL